MAMCVKYLNARSMHSLVCQYFVKVLPVNKARLICAPLQRCKRMPFHSSSAVKDVYEINSADDFRQKVISSKIPVIVNFHADWCEPCHSLKPLLEKYANNNLDKLHLAEICVDNHPELLQAFDVAAIPAVLAIQRGQVTDKFVGFISNKEIEVFVNRILDSGDEFDAT